MKSTIKFNNNTCTYTVTRYIVIRIIWPTFIRPSYKNLFNLKASKFHKHTKTKVAVQQ